MRRLRPLLAPVLLGWVAVSMPAQVVEFDSGGLRYQTLTQNGLTIMFSHLPDQVRQYGILQVAISNGSSEPRTLRPDDFRLEFGDGSVVRAVPALQVINELIEGASDGDMLSLVTRYEASLMGMPRIRSTRGFEQRRQTYIGAGFPKRLMAAAAASSIAFVETTLYPGESTDGAVFYPIESGLTGDRVLIVSAGGQEFVFSASQPVTRTP